MKVAALYDVHGNLPALEAVVAELDHLGVDIVVVGGDVVPGPMPVECLDLLMSLSVPTRFVVGNGEIDALAFRRGEAPARVPEAFHGSMRWNAARLSDEHAAEIGSWPSHVTLDVGGPVLFCHALPDDENAIFTRLTSEEVLLRKLEGYEADVIVCGHTHMQFDRRVGALRLMNAGSVGMPFGRPGAHWLLLEPGERALRRTPYDVREATDRIAATGYPDASVMRLVEPPSEAVMVAAFEAASIR